MAEHKVTTTVTDYLDWRGDLTFQAAAFNEVDSLLLCIFSYINFSRIPELTVWEPEKALSIGQVCSRLTEKDEQMGLSQLDYIPVMRQAAETERFREVKMFAFDSRNDETQEMQFAAVSFLLPDGSVYAAYRGTDLSLVGWKEDFNLSYLAEVPAQVRATEYACRVAAACPRRGLRLGGHSKGGNLAAWAGVHLPEKMQKKRLMAVYNNDGPGFNQSMAKKEEYLRIQDKIYTFIPEGSIVGMLLEHGEDYTVVASTARSVMQHEPMSWLVVGTGFVHLGERSQLGRVTDEVLKEWLDSMTRQERQEFCDAFFDILSMGGKTKSLDEVQEMGISGAIALLKEYMGADERKKKIISEIFKRLAADVKEEVTAGAYEGLQSANRKLKGVGQKLSEKIEKIK